MRSQIRRLSARKRKRKIKTGNKEMENEMDEMKKVDVPGAYKTLLLAIPLLLQDYGVNLEPARAGVVLTDPCRTQLSAVGVLQAAEKHCGKENFICT